MHKCLPAKNLSVKQYRYKLVISGTLYFISYAFDYFIALFMYLFPVKTAGTFPPKYSNIGQYRNKLVISRTLFFASVGRC